VAAPGYRVGDEGTQLSLPLELPHAPPLRALQPWDAMIADYMTTGLTVGEHPIALLRPGLAAGMASSADLERLRHGTRVRIPGLVVARQRPGTANGITFLLLEDEAGTVNLIVPPEVYERERLTVRTEPLVIAEGVLERFASGGGAINVLVRGIAPLQTPDTGAARPAAEVHDFSLLDAEQLAQRDSRSPGSADDDFRAVAPAVQSFASGRRR
jgi:error-prone DNA polymerase